MPDARGNRLRTIGTLADTHLGRKVTIKGDPDLTGKLAGLVPIGDRYRAVLVIGASRVFTDAIPADTHVEVWGKGVGA